MTKWPVQKQPQGTTQKHVQRFSVFNFFIFFKFHCPDKGCSPTHYIIKYGSMRVAFRPG